MKFQQPYRRQTNQDYTRKPQEYLLLHARHIRTTFLSAYTSVLNTTFILNFIWRTVGFKGIQRDKNQKTLLPKCLGELGTDKTFPKETKPHLMWQALPPFSETHFAFLFRSLLITVCIWLSQTAAARETLHCNWYLLAAPLWLPLTAHPRRLTAWHFIFLLHSACLLARQDA